MDIRVGDKVWFSHRDHKKKLFGMISLVEPYNADNGFTHCQSYSIDTREHGTLFHVYEDEIYVKTPNCKELSSL